MAGTNKRSELSEREAARLKVMKKPERHRIFIILAERPATPKELADELELELHTAMYHVRVLAGTEKKHSNRFPFIKQVGTDRKRGATQRIYEAVVPPVIGVQEAADMDRETREHDSDFIVPFVIDDLREARAEGVMDLDPQRTLLRYHDLMDTDGLFELANLAMEFLDAQMRVSKEAKARVARGETEGFPFAMNTMMHRVSAIYGGKREST